MNDSNIKEGFNILLKRYELLINEIKELKDQEISILKNEIKEHKNHIEHNKKDIEILKNELNFFKNDINKNCKISFDKVKNEINNINKNCKTLGENVNDTFKPVTHNINICIKNFNDIKKNFDDNNENIKNLKLKNIFIIDTINQLLKKNNIILQYDFNEYINDNVKKFEEHILNKTKEPTTKEQQTNI